VNFAGLYSPARNYSVIQMQSVHKKCFCWEYLDDRQADIFSNGAFPDRHYFTMKLFNGLTKRFSEA
jgi:hypothetical protein